MFSQLRRSNETVFMDFALIILICFIHRSVFISDDTRSNGCVALHSVRLHRCTKSRSVNYGASATHNVSMNKTL